MRRALAWSLLSDEEVSSESEANRGDKPFLITRPDGQGQAGAEITAQNSDHRHGQGVITSHLSPGRAASDVDGAAGRRQHHGGARLGAAKD